MKTVGDWWFVVFAVVEEGEGGKGVDWYVDPGINTRVGLGCGVWA